MPRWRYLICQRSPSYRMEETSPVFKAQHARPSREEAYQARQQQKEKTQGGRDRDTLHFKVI